jgi:hypothetical protein
MEEIADPEARASLARMKQLAPLLSEELLLRKLKEAQYQVRYFEETVRCLLYRQEVNSEQNLVPQFKGEIRSRKCQAANKERAKKEAAQTSCKLKEAPNSGKELPGSEQ